MSALILEYALGNTLLAVPLALLAWAIGQSRRYPSLAHLAWLLVMVRLVMPPIATLPWLTVSIPLLQPAASTADGRQGQETREISVAPDQRSPSPPSASMMAPGAGAGSPAAKGSRARIGTPEATISAVDQGLAVGFVGAIWLAGTVLIVAISIVRIARFRREVLMHCQPAGQAVLCLARSAADELGVRRGYALLTTRADAIPFVWSGLRGPVIVIPATLITDVHVPSLRLILMHELAHIRRRDHLVRWLDWAVVAWLWWNPLAWIARRGLRSSEELACDALVMRTCGASSREYGACLVAAAESFGRLAFRTPDQACTMGDGGSLEQRITIIMSGSLKRRPSLPLRAFTAGSQRHVSCPAPQPTRVPSRPVPSQRMTAQPIGNLVAPSNRLRMLKVTSKDAPSPQRQPVMSSR